MTPKPSERLGAYFRSRREKGKAGLPTMSVTLDRGLVLRDSIDRKMETNLSPDEHLRVYPGDIAYNMMRMWQGASGMAEADGIVSPAYVVLAPKPNVDPLFASYLFKTSEMIHRFWAFSYGLTDDRLRLYPRDFTLIPATLPPLPEQQKIAEILGTWDKAIETTEALLANARTQKRALMQSLLTGTRRFSGFEDHPWREVRLGDIGKTISGGTPESENPACWDGDIPWATPTDITKLTSRFISSTARMITDAGLKASAAKLVPKGAILVCTRATIGEVAIATAPICTNQGFKNIVLNEGYDADFVYYMIQFFKKDLIRYACGSTFLEISKADFDKRAFRFPCLSEQKMIAETLNAAEDEIDEHRQVIDHLRTEKKSLMQQLLTGKRRVVA